MAETHQIIRELCSRREEFFRKSNEYFIRRNVAGQADDPINITDLGIEIDTLRGQVQELENQLENQPNHINMDIWNILDPGEGGWPQGSIEFFDKVMNSGGSITVTSKTTKEPLITITQPEIWEEVKQIFKIA